jgi:UDP-N-acetylglucosamine pyrophosphorylase
MYNSVDQKILQHMIDSQSEFLMEVTDKTKADVKVQLVFHLFGDIIISINCREEHSSTMMDLSSFSRYLKFPMTM